MKVRACAFAASLLFGFVGVTMSACGPGAGALCDLECECEGCSQAGYESCLREADSEAREADFRGCGGYYDEFLSCQDATGVCHGADWETSCKPERDRYRNCMEGR